MRRLFKKLDLYYYDETVRWNHALNLWKFFLAYFRLSNKAICDMSRGGMDFHDYPDEDEMAAPWHEYTYHCSRCGKAFTI